MNFDHESQGYQASVVSTSKADLTIRSRVGSLSSKASSVVHDESQLFHNISLGKVPQLGIQYQPFNVENTNVVYWTGPADRDPENPRNWPMKKKWTNILVVSSITFVVPLASSMFAPGVPSVMREFHNTSQEIATFVVSIYLIGFALGPLIFAPLSEIFGRVLLYNITNVLFVLFSIGCARSTNMGMLIAFRLLAGCVGGTPLTIGAGTLTDLLPPEQMASGMAVFTIGPLLGPVVGPIIGGFLVEAKGWRWVFWLLAILSGTLSVLSFFVLKETYAPVILERKAAALRKSTGNMEYQSKLSQGLPKHMLILRGVVRPLKLLIFSPLCLLISFYIAIGYGILYILFTTFTYVFEDRYHFKPSLIGLSYLGIGIGMMMASGVGGKLSDGIIQKIKASGKEVKPEARVAYIMTLPGAFCIPVGLFVYGWTAQYHVHWIVPIIGTSIIGYGLTGIMFPLQNYIIDSFALYSASAMAATAVLRSIVGALLPLAGLRMIDAMGLGWSNSLLALVSLALIPVPIAFKIWGERIRTHPRFQVQL